MNLGPINTLAEFERLGWEYEFTGDNEIKCKCPAHNDKNPSCAVNVENKMWKCHSAGCNASGDIVSFIALATKTTRRVVMEDLGARYALDEVKVIDITTVERYHQRVWEAKPLLRELYKRGLTDDDVRKFRIGTDRGRLTIPVLNEMGLCVNIRRYLPGAPFDDKMRNTRGHGEVRLFPIDQLKFDTMMICGGECKSIVAARNLNPHQIGAINATGGEGNWTPEFSKLFKGKKVYICLDIDAAGRKSADKVAAMVKTYAKWVGVIQLPLDLDRYPHGDINDYFGQEHKTDADLLALCKSCEEWTAPAVTETVDHRPLLETTVDQSTLAVHAGRLIRLKGTVAAIDDKPYLIPKTVSCTCTRDQEGCSQCPVYMIPPVKGVVGVELTISKESPAIIGMVNSSKTTQPMHLTEALGVPKCKVVDFKTVDHYNVEEVRIVPPLDMTARGSDKMITGLSVSHGLEGNSTYVFTGRVHPHPTTQAAVMLISDQEAAEDALSQHHPDDDELGELAVFQTESDTLESIQTKLDDIYTDLEANVTRIYCRRDLHLCIDLVYHSALWVRFDNRTVKGWAEALVIGDSAQGKSETTKCLMEHYNLGEKIDSKNASVAGLLGGVQQLGNRWFVTWGKIPMQDRRLVVLEELKGASVETISKLTDMRSSGIAEIDKIEKRRTHARTRLIALSNPRSNQPMSSYNYGLDAISELIHNPEDIRRFDMALVVSTTQVNGSDLNQLTRHRPQVPHVYNADLSRKLVLWAWSRAHDQVQFTEEATEYVLDAANKLCDKYCDIVPLLDRGSTRLKLARLATALAARVFSHGTDSRQSILVKACHVEFIEKYLDRVYEDTSFGYADFSRAHVANTKLKDPESVTRKILATPFPADFIEHMQSTNDIELRDICDWCGWERGEATELLSMLVRKNALKRDARGYRKSSEFINLLKAIKGSKEYATMCRPEFVKERSF